MIRAPLLFLNGLFLTGLFLIGMALFRPAAADQNTAPVTIFAAASLTTVMTEITDAFQSQSLGTARTVFGSSAALARQIEYGAPADVLVSANPDWIAYLGARGLIDPGSRRAVAGNRLVLAVAQDNPADVTSLPDQGLLAMADPGAVPAGRYAKEALSAVGRWADVAKRAVFAPDVRAALAWVARGEVASGIVYATDAAAEPMVRVGYVFPAANHTPILYQAAVIADARSPELARQFLDFLESPAARALFARHGFLPPPADAP